MYPKESGKKSPCFSKLKKIRIICTTLSIFISATVASQENGYPGVVDLPNIIEAENYSAAPVETSKGNASTRNGAVIENCIYYGLDVDVANIEGGTCQVGYTSPGETLEYQLGLAGGHYDLEIKIASKFAGKPVDVKINGQRVGAVLTTGGSWSTWTTELLEGINIPTNARLAISFPEGKVNIDWINVVDSAKNVSSAIPGTIWPEFFNNFNESSAESIGNCRDDLAVDFSIDVSSPFRTCHISATIKKEWLEYPVDVLKAGNYNLKLVLSSKSPDKRVRLFFNNNNIGTVRLKGGDPRWDMKEEFVIPEVALPAGPGILKVFFISGYTHFYKIDISKTIEPIGDIGLVHHNDDHLAFVKSKIEAEDPYFYPLYETLIQKANKALAKAADPVTNKTNMPPSGSKNDYLSLAPYWWPDPSKTDGLPWVRRDGQVNPATRGKHTDQRRLAAFFSSLHDLSFAYYFSGDDRYIVKAKELVEVWIINPETRMNPNINFGQGVPGSVSGRAAGVIEFAGITSLVTAAQVIHNTGGFNAEEKATVDTWFSDMLTWLRTHPYALKEDRSKGNHANWYDVQVLSIMLYLGRSEDAFVHAEKAKIERIERQITPEGQQPSELGRTKSVNYSTMNLRAMSFVAHMARAVDVDLWNYESTDGRSMRKAFEFLQPYVLGEKEWEWKQITNGGKEEALRTLTKPMMCKASTILGEKLLPDSALEEGCKGLDDVDQLIYPSLLQLDTLP